MKKAIWAISLAAILLPLTACAAQTNTDSAGTTQVAAADPGATGPSADARAAMTQARNDAKTASLNALSADHRAKVQAVVDQFNGGSSTDLVGPAKAIDAILTPAEATAVLAQETKMRASMRAAMRASNPNSPARGNGTSKRTPDAGRFLFSAMASRERLRAARTQASN
jgi:hypothetical protein